jgi:uncharacterized protein YqeY
MSIEETLSRKFKEAFKSKDQATLNVIRMVRSEVKKFVTSGKFEGDPDDEVWRQVIQTYVKKLKKALPEYEQGGERGKEMAESLQFEIEFLKPFMPELLGEAETSQLVKETVEKISATSPKMAGKVVGIIMKDHKGKVDPALAKRIAEKMLGGE